ncbi:MAG: hypothetical protein LUD72_08575 [Bacteroidales bacterium]|nr:hypothetical protein [Bacteroidales bacterium]
MEKGEKRLVYGQEFEEEPIDLCYAVDPELEDAVVSGKIIHICHQNNYHGRPMIGFRITDNTFILLVRFFVDIKKRADLLKVLKKGTFVVVKGVLEWDLFDVEVGIGDVYGIYLISEFNSSEEKVNG